MREHDGHDHGRLYICNARFYSVCESWYKELYSDKNCRVLDDRWVVQSVDSSLMFQPCQGAGTVADTNNCQYVVDLSVYILYSIAYKDSF